MVLFFHFTDVTDDATYAECEVDESGRMVAIDGGDVQPGTLYRLATHSALLKTVVQGLRRWRNVRGVREAAKRSFELTTRVPRHVQA
ncbi:MAG: hypothetical protein R3E12_18795 [Candidatus Eisenbacteria bacterium]